MTLDLLFENGRLVDGTGAPWFRGALGIRDGCIEHVGLDPEPDLTAGTVIDLDDDAVAPGFVDAHSHSGLAPFREAGVEPKVRQGVTTEVVGQDGLSMAPVDPERGREWLRYLRGIVGGAGDRERPWATTGEYLAAVERAGTPANVATLVGHGTVRYEVLGMEDRSPTEAELEAMADHVARALDAGAVGFSTGLEYSPQRHATTGEVRRLAAELGPHGRPFVAHVRSYSRDMWAALDEFVDIGATEGVPVHLSHFKLGGSNVGRHERALELAAAARDRGVDFTADLYPYVPGNSMLAALLPPWAHVGGPDEILSRLRDEEARRRIERDLEANEGSWAIEWSNLVISHVATPANEDALGRTLTEHAAARGTDPFDAMCDLLVEEDLEVAVILRNPAEGAEADIRAVLSDERVAIGSDGIFGAHPHPRLYGTYPRTLGTYVRELDLLSMEEAVRKMTSLPARIYGLDRKGLLREGMDADLVVFDPYTVGSTATIEDPHRFPTGISHVLVDGEFVVRDGARTDATPGAAIRA